MDTPSTGGLQYLAVYGSLMAAQRPAELSGAEKMLRLAGPCLVAGKLYDLGEYPGLVPGEGVVHGELYEIQDPALLPRFDAYEAYYPGQPDRSLFLRRQVLLIKPAVNCWVYFYNRDIDGKPPIPSGNWPNHLEARAQKPAG